MQSLLFRYTKSMLTHAKEFGYSTPGNVSGGLWIARISRP